MGQMRHHRPLDVAEAMIDDYYDELPKEESGRHPS
jgi:hypothetical protein